MRFSWRSPKDTVSQTDVTSPLSTILVGKLLIHDLKLAWPENKLSLPVCPSSGLFLLAVRDSHPEPTG